MPAPCNCSSSYSSLPRPLQMLLSALRRNFGGVSETAFGLLTTRFLVECGFGAELRAGAVGSQALNTVATLRESLSDSLSDEDDPNTAPYRHVLLLDPTDVEVTVGMVRSHAAAGLPLLWGWPYPALLWGCGVTSILPPLLAGL